MPGREALDAFDQFFETPIVAHSDEEMEMSKGPVLGVGLPMRVDLLSANGRLSCNTSQ